jgi:hypothetical protein
MSPLDYLIMLASIVYLMVILRVLQSAYLFALNCGYLRRASGNLLETLLYMKSCDLKLNDEVWGSLEDVIEVFLQALKIWKTSIYKGNSCKIFVES